MVFEMPKVNSGLDWPSLDLKDLPRNEKHEKRTRAVDLSQQRSTAEIEAALGKGKWNFLLYFRSHICIWPGWEYMVPHSIAKSIRFQIPIQ